jgi:hypothetical protein
MSFIKGIQGVQGVPLVKHYKKQFDDIAMQTLYESLRDEGKGIYLAINETVIRFREYDENKPLSIFVK